MVNEKIHVEQSALEVYDAIAPVYDEYAQKKYAYLNAVDGLVQARIKDGARLLDIGAGDGRRLAKIKADKHLSEVVAIEPSAEMAKICRLKADCDVHEVFAERISDLNLGEFDVVTALWNVFGHIPTTEKRLKALWNIHACLKPNGVFMMDVNNRHNAAAYGGLKVLGRVVLDTLAFDERRGDAHYDWVIGDQTFKGFGHLFTPSEIEKLFKQVNLNVLERLSVNYATGEVSKSPYKGQMFYALQKI